MRLTTLIVLLALPTLSLAAVAEESQWPEDALLISDLIEARTHETCLVSLIGPDSALVAFVATGDEWTDSDANWNTLMLIYAITSGVDMEKYWDILDVAVSFGDAWCSIPMEDIFWLSNDEDLTEDEWWEELRNRTEIHIPE